MCGFGNTIGNTVGYILAHNQGYGAVGSPTATQSWVWNNIGLVLSCLGGGGSSNKAAKTSFFTKIASNNMSNLRIATEDSKDNIVDDATTSKKQEEITANQSKSIDNLTKSVGEISGLADYLKQVEPPFLYNTGNDPVVTYNDRLGPFKINYDNTNGSNAYSRLTEVRINYYDGSTEKVGVGNIKPNEEFYLTNPDLEKEVVSIGIHLRKDVTFETANYDQYAGVSSEIENNAANKAAVANKVANDPEIKNNYKVTDVVVHTVELDNPYNPQDTLYTSYAEVKAKAELDITIEVIAKKGTIELTKKGLYDTKEPVKDENGNYEIVNGEKVYVEKKYEEILPNVTFKVYCDTVGKYVESTEGTVKFTPNMESAKEYKTDENGVVLIEDLFAGRGPGDGYTYKLIEVYEEDNENYYYIDPIKIDLKENEYETGHWEVNGKKYCTIENVVVYYDDDYTEGGSQGRRKKTYITIKDDRTSGDLLIEKTDETFPKNVKLEGAKFKVKLVRSAHADAEGVEDPDHDLGLANMWLKDLSKCQKNSPNRKDSNTQGVKENVAEIMSVGASASTADDEGANVYDYSEFLHDEYLTANEDEAQEFVTSATGKIKILCVVNGEYEIYEVGASEGYDITRQWYYGTDTEHEEWVDYGKEEDHFENWGEYGEEYYPEWSDHGIVKVLKEDNYAKRVYSNRKIVSKIKGNIWEDKAFASKDGAGEYDSINGSGDALLPAEEIDKIKVRLWIRETEKDDAKNLVRVDKGIDGIPLKNQTGYEGYKKVAEVKVNSNGSWEITQKDPEEGQESDLGKLDLDIYYWELADGFIEYIYNNQEYVCTDVFANGNASVPVNSKAKEEKITDLELDDRNLVGADADITEEDKYYGSAITTKDVIEASEETAQDIIKARWEDYDLNKLGLTGYYNKETYEVENINLGLWSKEKPKFSVQQTLEYSKILMNGYTYTYDYNSAGITMDNESSGSGKYVPTTNTEVGQNVYGAKMYPSDIAYMAENNPTDENRVDDKLQMYVVYKVSVRNDEVLHKDNIYDEMMLYVDSLVNEYDSYKYSVDNESHKGDKNWEGSEYFELWEDVPAQDEAGLYDNSYSTYDGKKLEKEVFAENSTDRRFANYDINRDKGTLSDGIKESDTESVYIQFRVNTEFLKDMLEGLKPNRNSCAVSIAHIVAHHTYTRTDNVWNDLKEDGDYYIDEAVNTKATNSTARKNVRQDPDVAVKTAREQYEQEVTKEREAGREKDGDLNKKHLLHRYGDEYKNTGSLGLMFMLGEERVIAGNVFEDLPTEESRREDVDTNVGNGIIDNENRRVSGVKVQLLDASTSDEETDLYQKNEAGGYSVVDARTKTNDSGYYEFVGLVPGVYKIRFTYSDGSQYITDINEEGNYVAVQENGKNIDVNSYDYKSTIINTNSEVDEATGLYKGAANFIRNPEETTKDDFITATDNYKDAILQKDYNRETVEDISDRQLTEWYKEIYNNDSGIKYNTATDNFNGDTNVDLDLEKFEDYQGKQEYNRTDFIENEYSTEYGLNEDGETNKTKVKTKITEEGSEVEAKPQEETIPIMRSYTPYFSISIENDTADTRDVNRESYTNEANSENRSGKNMGYGHRPYYDNFNLGLIKTTETKLSLDKIISNIKLTSSSGVVLVQGEPDKMQDYITALDDLESGGSKYVRVEMGLDDIYGSQIETTYSIKISNESVRDYIEDPIKDENGKATNKYFGFYFKYGDKDSPYFEEPETMRDASKKAYLMQATVTEVRDLLDPDYDLLDTEIREIVYHPVESRPEGKEWTEILEGTKNENKGVTVRVDENETGKFLVFTDWNPIERDANTQIKYSVNGLFREGMDLIYDNAAQITKIKLDYAQVLRSNYVWQGPMTTRLIITPDTGGDRSLTYYIVGVLGLLILATGIVVIKKLITKEK